MRPFLLLTFLLSFAARAEERSECQIAIVEASEGNSVVISPDGKGAALEDGQAIQPGDLLKTGRNAWVDLRLCDGSGLRVGENAKFHYESVNIEQASFVDWAFRLLRGSLLGTVSSENKGERVKLRVKTPTAALGVRGTEFVLDVDDVGPMETNLHTLEGEVLLGHADEFEKLRELRGSALSERFESVGKEKMSLIRRGESRPLRAAAFKLWEFRAERRPLFARPFARPGWTEIRQRFLETHKKWLERRQNRGLFQRSREKLEQRIEGRQERLEKLQERIEKKQERAAERVERLHDKAGEHGPKKIEGRQTRIEDLKDRMRQHQVERKQQMNPNNWKKNLHQVPASPRFPNLPHGHR